MTYPDRISVYHKLRHDPTQHQSHQDPQSDTDEVASSCGTTTTTTTSLLPNSFTLDCIVLSHNSRRAAAKLEEDIVIYDYGLARKTAMPPFMAAVLSETYATQLAEMRRARERIWDLIRQVESLEKETWDRKDAVEDMGR